MAWSLPSSPDSPEFLDRLDDWQLCPDPAKKIAKGRAFAEDDYYAYLKYFSNFGQYRIKEPGHPRNGGYWIDEPLLFEMVRQWQLDREARVDDVWWNQPRFHMKTALLGRHACQWIILREPSRTICILTFKVDKVGIKMFAAIKRDLETTAAIHEHWPDIIPESPEVSCPLWTRTEITVLRPQGPADPSISIHSLSHQPVSGHYTDILVDDAEVEETVTTAEVITETKDLIRKTTALQESDTRRWFLGTIWDGEGPQMQLFREGFFARRQGPWDCFGPDGETPVLRSKRLIRSWRKLGHYQFGCQMRGTPPARGTQYFLLEQLHRYHNSPLEERRGKNVIAIVDPAKGASPTGKKRDFSCIFIYGLGHDKKIYLLDMWIERMTMIEAADMLFGPKEDEEGNIAESRKWMPRQGLIKRWKVKTVYVEDFAVTGWYEHLNHEREVRMYRAARFVALPPPGWHFWPKENRIAALQPLYENEEILHPADGIGHATQHDPHRDVHQQYIETYLTKWVLGEKGGGLLHDDPLDTESWLAQPEVKRLLRYPVSAEEVDERDPEALWRQKIKKEQTLSPVEQFWLQ